MTDAGDLLRRALASAADVDYGEGHFVAEWVVCARVVDSDGNMRVYISWSDDIDEIVALGLAEKIRNDVDSQEDDDD